jgi:hypothetical protein
MPKKSTTVRGGAQRNKPKVQKSFELVKPSEARSTDLTDSTDATDEQELVANGEDEVTTSDVSASPSAVEVEVETLVEETKPRVTRRPERKTRETQTPLAIATPVETRKATNSRTSSDPVAASPTPASTPPKGSASARLVARRQAMQKAQQRAAASLITSDHYAYVRRDLRFIAILAAIMFAVIIILRFVPGIGS